MNPAGTPGPQVSDIATYRPLTAWQDSTPSVYTTPLAEIRVGSAHLSTCSAVRVKVRHSLHLGEFRFGLLELA